MEVKNGHHQIKEFHFHIYWFQQNAKAESQALAFKEALIQQVKLEPGFIVVCEGIDEKILPALKSPVPKVNRAPRGPHPCGSFEVGIERKNFLYIAHWGKTKFLILKFKISEKCEFCKNHTMKM